MKSNPVGWFEIYVQDLDRAKRFYEAVFATQLEKLDSPASEGGPAVEMWAFPMQQGGNGAAGTIVKMPGCPSGGGGTLVYFMCDDCANEARKAKESGGQIVKDKFSIGKYGFIALVSDTEGNTIGLHSMQ